MSLALTKADLDAEIGAFLGYGRGALQGDSAWTTRQYNDIAAIRKSGERQFYFNPPLPEVGIVAGYAWSFLQPVATLTLASGAQTVDLPDDYAGLEGRITLSTTSSNTWLPLSLVGEGMVRQAYAQQPDATGKPLMAAIRPLRGRGGSWGQRQELFFYPEADDSYTIQFRYYLAPEALSDANQTLYGGPQHSETILESCLAIAEQRLDDAMTVHTEKFKERLLASINMDRRNKPQLLGPVTDRSDLREAGPNIRRAGWPYWDYSVTVNGVQY